MFNRIFAWAGAEAGGYRTVRTRGVRIILEPHGETLFYSVLSILALVFVLYLFHFYPAGYVQLIAEDHGGEYAGAVCFGIAGVVLIGLSLGGGSPVRRALWMGIGLVALFLAGEEISWGQRILGIATPETFLHFNLQGEISLHNLEAFDTLSARAHRGIAILLPLWLLFSVCLSARLPRTREKLLAWGVPLIPIRLSAVFLLPACLFLSQSVAKVDEIEEMFLAIAAAIWAVDLCVLELAARRRAGPRALVVVVAMLGLATVLSAGLTIRHGGSLRWRLNRMAAHDYPKFRMYDQAAQLYEYIYAHPQYLQPDTRINHGRMLMERGEEERARRVLWEAVQQLDANRPLAGHYCEHLRRLGTAYALLHKQARADTNFDRAIEQDRAALVSETDPDEKAERIWSIARTMEARGDRSSARAQAASAQATARSTALRTRIGYWIETLETG